VKERLRPHCNLFPIANRPLGGVSSYEQVFKSLALCSRNVIELFHCWRVAYEGQLQMSGAREGCFETC
jgi:hypothetical protein